MSLNTNPANAQRVRIIENLYDYADHAVTVTAASASFATLIGSDLQDDAGEVEIVNQGGATIYYNPNGVATVGSMPIPTNSTYTAKGTKDILDNVRLVSGGAVNIHLIERVSAGD